MRANVFEKEDYLVVAGRKVVKNVDSSIFSSEQRPQVGNSKSIYKRLDSLPFIDRSLIDYEQYHKFVGHAGRKYHMALQATRGCPYKCFYCDIYKTTVNHYRRSVDNIIKELKVLSDLGVRRIEFIDDIFNVNKKHCALFFETIIKEKLNFQFMFPTGLKGDLLNKELIDLMVEGGTVGFNLSLEHASPRMQRVMRKNLDVDKFLDNFQYIAEKYPAVVTGLNAMHGFPTETEEEAFLTLNAIKSIKWVHFPYLFNVRVFPGTELEHFALEQGVPMDVIKESQDMSYEEASPTIPFSKDFTKGIRTLFLRDYVLNRERLLRILPHQMKLFTEDELNQKYSGYFPTRINSLNDLLEFAKIDRSELNVKKCVEESSIEIKNLNQKIKKISPKNKKSKSSLKLLLIDLSTYYSHGNEIREYNVIEPPLGLMALLTYINKSKIGKNVIGKICKSRIDFDSKEGLCSVIKEFNPSIIGIRAMTFYKNFFHDSVSYIRENGVSQPIIVGGPYATASYRELLKDRNVDVAVIAEGELTLTEILEKTIENRMKFPTKKILKNIPGLAFRKDF